MRVGKIFVDIAVLLKGWIFEVSVKEKETYSKRRVSQVSLAKRCSYFLRYKRKPSWDETTEKRKLALGEFQFDFFHLK